MRPFCLVVSRSQDTAANAGVISLSLTTILYFHRQLFIDIERYNLMLMVLLERENDSCRYFKTVGNNVVKILNIKHETFVLFYQ